MSEESALRLAGAVGLRALSAFALIAKSSSMGTCDDSSQWGFATEDTIMPIISPRQSPG